MEIFKVQKEKTPGPGVFKSFGFDTQAFLSGNQIVLFSRSASSKRPPFDLALFGFHISFSHNH